MMQILLISDASSGHGSPGPSYSPSHNWDKPHPQKRPTQCLVHWEPWLNHYAEVSAYPKASRELFL